MALQKQHYLVVDFLKHIFLYSDNNPYIFTELSFWSFFGVVLLFYSIFYKNKRVRNAYLFLVSLFFYYKTSGFFFFLLLFSTFSDFWIGKGIHKTASPLKKKLLLSLSVFLNLLMLSYFKYAYFFIDNINAVFGTHFQSFNYFANFSNWLVGSHFDIDIILLPVGISFFTFQTISYTVDVYKERIQPVKHILDFGFYVSFFPQLVAGPIVRASDFVPQLYQEYRLSKEAFGTAVFLIMKGLIKKVVIGDYIAINFIDRVFDQPLLYSGFENLMALYGYSLQVYADFSGYTDIAIGVALLMGFQLPLNFNSPYKAKNVGEFWKRWHISLSSWLKDYLYIPMGGNRKATWFTYIGMTIISLFIVIISGDLFYFYLFLGTAFALWLLGEIVPASKYHFYTNINLLVTMLLGGLWHGASWQFVIWGGLNGLGIVVYKYWRKISPFGKEQKGIWGQLIGVLVTFNFITFTRIWFRGENTEISRQILNQITQNFNIDIIPQVLWGFKNVFALMLVGFIIHYLPSTFKKQYEQYFVRMPIGAKALVCISAILLIYQAHSSDLQAFIYFQF